MRKTFWIIAVLLIILANAFLPVAHSIAFRPGGSTVPLSFAALAPLLMLLALFLLPLALLIMLWRRVRRLAAAAAALLFLHLVAFMVASVVSLSIRERGIVRLSERAQPLVQALHAYEDRTGRAPETLADLVPELLQEIPKIGLGEEYKYVPAEEARMHWGRSWALTVVLPSMWPYAETLVYLPDRRYEETIGSLRLQRRVGDWGVYVWD